MDTDRLHSGFSVAFASSMREEAACVNGAVADRLHRGEWQSDIAVFVRDEEHIRHGVQASLWSGGSVRRWSAESEPSPDAIVIATFDQVVPLMFRTVIVIMSGDDLAPLLPAVECAWRNRQTRAGSPAADHLLSACNHSRERVLVTVVRR